MTRQERISGILAAARKPVPQIVPSVKLLCDDGKWRGAMGIPWGVKTTGEKKTVGYVFRDARSGTTFGVLHPTEADAVKSWNANQDEQAAGFRAILEAATEEEFNSQAGYWLKGN